MVNTLKKDFVNYLNQCFEGGFVVDEDNRQQLRDFFQTFEDEKRGIIVIGPAGSGKSIIFEALNRVLNPKDTKRFRIENAVDIVHDYNIAGSEVFDTFLHKRNFVIDDLGFENLGKHYGSDCNVIEDLILQRYNLFKNSGVKTHFTTNLEIKDLKQKYGDRACSRLMEMCEIVVLKGSDRRRYRNFIQWFPVTHSQVFTQEDKEWHERYAAIREKRQAMTPEDIAAENMEGKMNFILGNNTAFQDFRKKFFAGSEDESNSENKTLVENKLGE